MPDAISWPAAATRKRNGPLVRLVAVDLDGTLLQADATLSETTIQAVKLAIQAGVHIVLASGRMHESVVPFAQALGLRSPIISYNGGLVRSDAAGDEWFRSEVPSAAATEIVELCRRRNLHLNYYADDRLLMSKDGPWAAFYQSHTGSPLVIRPGLLGDIPPSPTKLIIIDRGDVTSRLESELGPKFTGVLEITRTNPEYLEFMAIGTTKARALAVVAGGLGIPRCEVAALGDGRNDVEMLRWAGVGIAMCNGHPAAIAAAGHHCRSNHQEGAASVIRGYAEGMLSSGFGRSMT